MIMPDKTHDDFRVAMDLLRRCAQRAAVAAPLVVLEFASLADRAHFEMALRDSMNTEETMESMKYHTLVISGVSVRLSLTQPS